MMTAMMMITHRSLAGGEPPWLLEASLSDVSSGRLDLTAAQSEHLTGYAPQYLASPRYTKTSQTLADSSFNRCRCIQHGKTVTSNPNQ